MTRDELDEVWDWYFNLPDEKRDLIDDWWESGMKGPAPKIGVPEFDDMYD